MQDTRAYMIEAVELARDAHPHPNPRVGALVVDPTGQVVGRGSHLARGGPHAESIALAEAGDRARGATVVVTLEPCDHRGATSPCTDALLAAGVNRVVIGVIDPDSRVSGRGVSRLREAGITVDVGVAADVVEEMDPGYHHHRRTGRAAVTVKFAMTLDGQVAAADGSSQWITSVAARDDGHRLRARSDAVMVGAGTVASDDPRLTVRLDGYVGHQPRPVVIAGSRPLNPAAAVFARDPLVYSPLPVSLPGEVVVVPGDSGVDLPSVIEDLGKRKIVDVLVEGGPHLVGSLIRHDLVQRVVAYVASSLAAGSGLPAVDGVFETIGAQVGLEFKDVTRVGGDIRIEALVEAK